MPREPITDTELLNTVLLSIFGPTQTRGATGTRGLPDAALGLPGGVSSQSAEDARTQTARSQRQADAGTNARVSAGDNANDVVVETDVGSGAGTNEADGFDPTGLLPGVGIVLLNELLRRTMQPDALSGDVEPGAGAGRAQFDELARQGSTIEGEAVRPRLDDSGATTRALPGQEGIDQRILDAAIGGRQLVVPGQRLLPSGALSGELELRGDSARLEAQARQGSTVTGEVVRPELEGTRPRLEGTRPRLTDASTREQLPPPSREVVVAGEVVRTGPEERRTGPIDGEDNPLLEAPRQEQVTGPNETPVPERAQTVDDTGKEVRNLSVTDADGGQNLQRAVERRLNQRFGNNAFFVDLVADETGRRVQITGEDFENPITIRSFEDFFSLLREGGLGDPRTTASPATANSLVEEAERTSAKAVTRAEQDALKKRRAARAASRVIQSTR